MAQYPAINDTEEILLRKIADNFRDMGIADGAIGLKQSNNSDNDFDSLRKITFNSASVVDNQ